MADVDSFLANIDTHVGFSVSEVDGREVITFTIRPSYSVFVDAIDASNRDVLASRVADSPDAWDCTDYVACNVRDDAGEYTDAVQAFADAAAHLADYSVLDDELFSRYRDEWCSDMAHEFEDQAAELIEESDAAIRAAIDWSIDVPDLRAKPRDEAVGILAYALAEQAFSNS